MKIHEIFNSIQGEGKYAGYPTTFIRFFGCSAGCIWCDTKQEEYSEMTIAEILATMKTPCNHICITGGEPLEQGPDLLKLLKTLTKIYPKVTISVETNGLHQIYLLPSEVQVCMDVKTPSSKVSLEYDAMLRRLSQLNGKDEVKFVVKSQDDFDFMIKVYYDYLNEDNNKSMKEMPMFICSTHDGNLAKQLICYDLPNMKIGMQLHKMLGVS